MTEKDWYSNKDLYEMQVRLSKKMEGLSAELATTQTMIRDYNGLRERIDVCEQSIRAVEAEKKGSANMWGYVVGGFGVIAALISYAAKG